MWFGGKALSVASLTLIATAWSANAQTTDSAARLDAARKMIVASGYDKDMAAISAKYASDYTRRLKFSRPEIGEGEVNCFQIAFQKQLDQDRKQYVDHVAMAFSRVYTVDELNSMTAYYSSSSGKAIVAKHAQALIASMPFQSVWTESAAAKAARYVGILPYRPNVTVWDRLASSLDALEGAANAPAHLTGCTVKASAP